MASLAKASRRKADGLELDPRLTQKHTDGERREILLDAAAPGDLEASSAAVARGPAAAGPPPDGPRSGSPAACLVWQRRT